ncbi:hypothetical protein [Paracidovorax cattleyae]|uniref:hypothetical protein n=1 Tax=Paracidovorax cattleyae TaxID=80868 RepID=UPI00115FEFFB|nr:hypothetical protein [Paracidovorax cattleyae]
MRKLFNVPLLLLMILIFGYAMAAFASSFQELAAKWLKAYSYMPHLAAYGLLLVHALLTPGLALLVYAIFLLKHGEGRSKFFQGIALLIYLPFRLVFIFILLGFFPLWLIFELVESVILIYAGKCLVKEGGEKLPHNLSGR